MRLRVDPERPAPRQLQPAIDALKKGSIIVYPTDTGYAFGCAISSHRGVDQLRRIKGVSAKERKPFTILVAGLEELALFGQVDNRTFRVVRRLLPGPYTVVLQASSRLPRPLRNRGNEVGMRVSENLVCALLREGAGEPLITSSVRAAVEVPELEEPDELYERYENQLGAFVDVGPIWPEPSTVLRMADGEIEVLRDGQGTLPDVLNDARRHNAESWREF